MTPSIAGPDAAGDPPPIRLGPSAAWRCRRRLHLDVVSQLDPAHDGAPPDDRQPDGQPQGHGQLTDGGRSALPDAAQRARDELTRHRDLVFRLIRMARPAAAADAQRSSSVGPWWTDPQAVVLAPDMTTGGRSGAADLLVWWGDGYVPVLIRAHRTRDAGAGGLSSSLAEPVLIRVDPSRRTRRNRVDRLVLAHHFRQLTELGCASRTAFGGVIGRGGPGAETEPGGPGPGGPGPGGPGVWSLRGPGPVPVVPVPVTAVTFTAGTFTGVTSTRVRFTAPTIPVGTTTLRPTIETAPTAAAVRSPGGTSGAVTAR